MAIPSNSENTSLPPEYEVIKFHGATNLVILEQICKLRLSVWQDQKVKMVGDFSSGSWSDAEEVKSTHWAVFYAGELVAASRMTIYNFLSELPDARFYQELPEISAMPIGYLTRDVVLKEHQGKGLGEYFNRVRISELRNVRAKTVLASIPDYRISSFEKLGVKLIREPRLGYVFPEMKWAVVSMSL